MCFCLCVWDSSYRSCAMFRSLTGNQWELTSSFSSLLFSSHICTIWGFPAVAGTEMVAVDLLFPVCCGVQPVMDYWACFDTSYRC